jgi:high-affinity nickel-transport protein
MLDLPRPAMEVPPPTPDEDPALPVDPSTTSCITSLISRYNNMKSHTLLRLHNHHSRTPYLRRIPLPALLIIALIALINCLVWAICGLVLHAHGPLMATAALSYTLGLRHALDADHISAIDLMTRRLLAGNPKSRPVTVGTWFSLGHSTIVIITSIVVAATAAGVSKKFGSFGEIGGVIGSSVSAAFLLLLGLMNGYILYKLVMQLRLILSMPVGHETSPAALRVEGGGPLFRILKRLFKLIDRPWKMYPLGVCFGLGFDTSSEIALLGISSIQASRGTSIWLIMVFPVLFTAGMCLIDTIDGALMLAVYVAPMAVSAGRKEGGEEEITQLNDETMTFSERQVNENNNENNEEVQENKLKDPIMFLYYSIVLTSLTVMVALIIGTIQLLTMILNVTHATGHFWNGVQTAGDDYEIIGGSICASFVVVGGASVFFYKPWRRRVEESRRRRDADVLNRGEVMGRTEEGATEEIEEEEMVVAIDGKMSNKNERTAHISGAVTEASRTSLMNPLHERIADV